jgi:hypothetical protein
MDLHRASLSIPTFSGLHRGLAGHPPWRNIFCIISEAAAHSVYLSRSGATFGVVSIHASLPPHTMLRDSSAASFLASMFSFCALLPLQHFATLCLTPLLSHVLASAAKYRPLLWRPAPLQPPPFAAAAP